MSSPASSRKRAIGKHLIAMAIYSLLSLILTWPLVTHLSTHVPGDGIDDPALVWNLWWIQERLIHQLSLDLFNTDWMFHPIRINLAFYTLTPLNGLLSVPLQSAFGLVVANNILFLSTLVLGAYGTFLLTRWLLSRRTLLLRSDRSARHITGGSSQSAPLLTADDWIALVAGLIYGFASSKLFYASLGQFNIASSQWIPFFVLFVLRVLSSRTRADGFRAAAMAGVFLIFQTWAELTYATFLVIFAGMTFIYALVQLALEPRDNEQRDQEEPALVQTDISANRHPWRRFRVLLLQFGLIGVLFVVGVAPFLWAMAPDLLSEGDFFTSGGGFADVFSADLFGYLVPTRLHPWFGEAVAGLAFPNDKGQQIYVGYAAMLMAVVGAGGLVSSSSRRLRGEGWFWLVTTLFFWWLTLGPTMRWNGQSVGVSGPFALVSRLPFFSGNRYPSRYSVMLMLCISVLAAYGLAWLIDWLQRRERFHSETPRWLAPVTVLVLAGFFLAEHLATPLPLNDFRIPPIYQRLADLPDDTTLLELPTGWRNGARVLGRSDTLIMMQQWYQSEHGQRRLGGNTSRNPDYKFQYFTNAPLIGDLIGLMNADSDHIAQEVTRDWDAIVERNRSAAPAVLDFLGIEYLMVHVNHAPEPLLRFVDEVLPVSLVEEWQGPDWQGRPSTIRLYGVNDGADSVRQVDLGGDMANLYLAEGWSSFPVGDSIRYATRREAELMLDLPENGGEVSLQLFGPASSVDFLVNGTRVATAPVLDGDWTVFVLPAGIAEQTVDRLTLRFDGEGVPATQIVKSTSPEGWRIGDTEHFLAGDVAVVAHSAGEEVGDFAHIYLAGVDIAKNQRGYNLAAIGQDGTLLDSVAFDTFLSAAAAEEMSVWIQQWTAGTIIAGAVRDEASINLTDSAVENLRQIGVATDLRGRFRSSHAFVGVVGSPAGAALEEESVLHASAVTVGSPVDSEVVFGGVGAIRLPADGEKR